MKKTDKPDLLNELKRLSEKLKWNLADTGEYPQWRIGDCRRDKITEDVLTPLSTAIAREERRRPLVEKVIYCVEHGHWLAAKASAEELRDFDREG